ncbi:Sps19p [Sugiyamaella lignohabitans]|uniref:2,4-dienoyl-CoA reductase [(3E)-enoyl-CoA-producing] n=1 Tax=Sugiyamaella lignohabitans TaxID=796027 RepID=A0A167CBW1_9ASCO|nr:Sps19p [Sugiyamaella lignohabitans]ANB11482.1 Sps19p [Sugiyamaella lignohabitans]
MPNTLDSSYYETSIYKKGIFDGKVVFVTGGAGTICRVQVEALVLLGANAAILGRRTEATEKAAAEIQQLRPGAKVIGIGGVDVRDVKSLASAVDTTVKQLGKIDFVIAGAAGNFLSHVGGLSARAFKTVIDIDLLGSYNTAKATFDQLRANKGHILFVSATLHYIGLPMQAHASAAKAGVDSLMRTLAVELGPLGIQSNAIAPGPIAGTEGIDRLLPEHLAKRAVELVPLQRLGTTTDIANATVFLLSPAASYVTGTVTVVDGASWQLGEPSTSDPELYPGVISKLNEGDNKL